MECINGHAIDECNESYGGIICGICGATTSNGYEDADDSSDADEDEDCYDYGDLETAAEIAADMTPDEVF